MSRAVPCLLSASLVLTLGACSMPAWPGGDVDLAAAEVASVEDPSSEEPSVEEPSPEEPSPEEPPPVSITNELASGQAQRSIQAGDILLEIDYWSDLRIDRWTTDAAKPVTMNVVASLPADGLESVYLRQVSVTPSVIGPDGSTIAILDPFVDEAGVDPGVVVKDPYSYGQTFLLPAVDESAVAITLHIDYELLRQTTPTSEDYVQQSGSDSLTIALATD